MANILTPFGFKHLGNVGFGAAPSYEVRQRRIALGQTNPIFHGDPVQTVLGAAGGYIQQYVAGAGTTVAGIFQGCEYFSVSQQRKVRSNYWPGSDAQFDVDAFIIDAAFSQFYAATDGTVSATFAPGGVVNQGAIETNVDIKIATGGSATPVPGSGQGNTIAQLSGSLISPITIGTTATLPMRLIRPYSDFVVAGAPFAGSTGFPGADNTTPFAWWIVAFNSVESKQLTAHA
jgi:hypothetical protein